MTAVAVAVGGALGALARWWLSDSLQGGTPDLRFPWGTLTVNLLGALLLGLLYGALQHLQVSDELRAFMTIGVLGAFTTFSTFSFEAVALADGGALGRAALYLGTSVVLGVLLAWLGLQAGQAIAGP